MSGVIQGPILGLVLLDTFINDTGNEIECTLCKFAGDTKLSCAVGPAEEWDDVQRDLDKLEDLIKFNKCKLNFASTHVQSTAHGLRQLQR